MTYCIRQLVTADAESYRALRLESLTRAPTAFGSCYQDEAPLPLDAFRQRLDQSTTLGAFSNQNLIGSASFILPHTARRKQSHKGAIVGVYVQEDHRGSGAAAMLIDALLKRIPAGITHIQLTVSADNPRARRLYEKFGFTVWGTEPCALQEQGRYWDEWHMVKQL